MAQFTTPGKINATVVFNQGFFGLADETVYSDPLGATGRVGLKSDLTGDLWNRFNELKSTMTTTGDPGLTDNGLIPISYDKRILDLTRKQTPLSSIIPRVANQGIIAPYRSITDAGSAAFGAEGGAIPVNDFETQTQSVNIKYMYARGAIEGQANAAMPGYTLEGTSPMGGATDGFSNLQASNADSMNVLIQAKVMRELEENAIINGDASTNPLEYSGIIKTMGVVNTVDKNSAAIALSDYDLASTYAFEDGGFPTIAICDARTWNDTKQLLQAKITYRNYNPIAEFGFSSLVIETINGRLDVIPSRFMTSTSGSKAAYLLDLSVWENRVLLDMSYERLGKTRDANEFFLKQYSALICRATQFNASITEIL